MPGPTQPEDRDRRNTALKRSSLTQRSAGLPIVPKPPTHSKRRRRLVLALVAVVIGVLMWDYAALWIRRAPSYEPPPPRPEGGEVLKSERPPAAPEAPRAPAGGLVTLPRYPNMDVPDRVSEGLDFAVVVSLTETPQSPRTVVQQGEVAPDGALIARLPDRHAWKVDVVLSAYDFVIRDGANSQSIALLPRGDSTPAVFHLRARPTTKPLEMRPIMATLWHEGAYIGRIGRSIQVGRRSQALHGAQDEVQQGTSSSRWAQSGPIAVDAAQEQPDLTLFLTSQATAPDLQMVTVSPYLRPPTVSTVRTPGDLRSWLESHYETFARSSSRGVTSVDGAPRASGPLVTAQLQGFGRELYRRYAPQDFKNAFWRLRDQLGDRFRSIQIFTDDPLVPWELMRPFRDAEEADFLGIEFQIARWHVGGPSQLERPPRVVRVSELAVISPTYSAPRDALPAQDIELERLRRVPGYRAVPAGFHGLSRLAASPPEGIVHFAGHSIVRLSPQGIAQYALILEDAQVDLMAWRGLMAKSLPSHPFFFFNSCHLGGALRIADFVEGWGPALLDVGASGYIGGLWPLGDAGAAEFARRFYDQLDPAFLTRPVLVSEILRRARLGFYERADPTFLAYVLYGDPFLSLARGGTR